MGEESGEAICSGEAKPTASTKCTFSSSIYIFIHKYCTTLQVSISSTNIKQNKKTNIRLTNVKNTSEHWMWWFGLVNVTMQEID